MPGIQAALGLDRFKMAVSPLTKLEFDPEDKENTQQEAPVVVDLDLKKAPAEAVKEVEPVVAATIKPSEADEPLLQENPHRFVLFPIKYHEVCAQQRVTCEALFGDNEADPRQSRCGKCTRRQKHRSGLRRKSIFQKIYTTGITD